MSKRNSNEPTKSEVYTTKLNKMPVPGEGLDNTEFSAEAAAEVFMNNPPSSEKTSKNQQ
ncbi:hypothetical protein [Paenibacillus dakarensis]|uniref:hypothetical protein n=1 Tax=Paenibacillus dakarensis TaxID=1527293 RepID=UPI000AF77586|nr:hypothetical protein [Paenibacillus dakarensis]